MINVSNEYKQAIRQNRIFDVIATVELKDNTLLTLTKSDFMQNGLAISDGTSSSNKFVLGSAIINCLQVSLNNADRKFDMYDFDGATFRPEIGLKLSATTEFMQKGVFTVGENASVVGNTINLTLYDNMRKFDKPFSDVAYSVGTTMMQLLQSICSHCGVMLATASFLNQNFTVARLIEDEATTCREVISYIAQLSGNFARVNTTGYLELKWYNFAAIQNNIDGGIFDNTTEDSYQSGDDVYGGDFTFAPTTEYDGGTFTDLNAFHHFFSLSACSVDSDDVVITGVQVKAVGTETDYAETVLFGTQGYIIEIADNPLITENTAATIANSVGAAIVGMTFRPCQFSALSDPSVEAGDVGYLSDNKGNAYPILITNTDFKINNRQNISCDAEPTTKKLATRYSPETKTIIEARKNAEVQLSAYDIIVRQITSVITNGLGLYDATIDGIYYQIDKSTMEESVIRFFTTTGGYIQQTRPTTADEWITTSGVDIYGNALYNTISTRGINFDWASGGTLKLGGQTNGNGLMDVYDSINRLISKIDMNGMKLYCYSNNYVALEATYDNGAGTIFKTSILGTRITTPSVVCENPLNINQYAMVDYDGISLMKDGYSKFSLSENGEAELKSVFTTDGASGDFTTSDGKTVTVSGGIITSIV